MKNPIGTTRAGFSLIELLIALTITAVIGVAMTGLFMTQARFLELQQKQEFARGVTRSASNIMMSELRMIDRDSGVAAASDTSLTVRVPYAMGMVCASTATLLTLSVLPVDSATYTGASIGGFAYRQSDGRYKYVAAATAPSLNAGSTACSLAGITVVSGGTIRQFATAALVPAGVGAPVLIYQTVRYHFSASTAVSGRRGLYRAVPAASLDEEIVAPFDTSAKFGFYVNDARAAQTTAPTTLSTLTGIKLTLNSINEKPNPDGTYTVVLLSTAVFFKNRRN